MQRTRTSAARGLGNGTRSSGERSDRSAVRHQLTPGLVSGVEKQKPGSEGTITSKASAGSPPNAAGSAREQRLDGLLAPFFGVFACGHTANRIYDPLWQAASEYRMPLFGFLASILPFTNATWEKLSTFLNFLIPKLPAPKEEDLSKGILESIDMESYRPEVRSTLSIALADQNAEIGPVPTSGGGHLPEPELDRLSNIVKAFNEQFGNIDWKDADQIRKLIAEEIPVKVAADKAYQNAMKNSDKQNARIEHDKALQRVIIDLLNDHTELFKQFQDNAAFKKWLSDTNFASTYADVGSGPSETPKV
jgi:hypothetical protein